MSLDTPMNADAPSPVGTTPGALCATSASVGIEARSAFGIPHSAFG